MIIDTHCHIDMYPNPIAILNECEKRGVTVISMTNLPSHFELGLNHFKNKKRVRQALGFHPLIIKKYDQKEISKFELFINHTSFIGEIGLDFSREGLPSKEIQLQIFSKLLSVIKNCSSNKILSLHSRGAEKEVLAKLIENNIDYAIFHWYSGSIATIEEILNAGYYFSINTSMIKSKKGKEIIGKIPLNRLLVESDGPFIDTKSNPINPFDLIEVYNYIGLAYNIPLQRALDLVKNNFYYLMSKIQS